LHVALAQYRDLGYEEALREGAAHARCNEKVAFYNVGVAGETAS
jgi:hypothetical protein